jgi:leader peptidase (prepilin peptidase)/N-methyltransferase
MIRILGTIFAGLMGLAFGSFLNVCLSRWPQGESVVSPRSHCRNCGRTLAWWENVPLVSWLALRGRCRTCRAWIGWRYPLVELAVGALWAQQTWRFFESLSQPVFPEGAAFGLKWAFFDAAAKMLLYWLLVALAVLDVENLWLPNRLTIPGILSGLGFSIAAAYRMSWGSNGASDWGAGSVFLEGTFLAHLLAIVLGVLLAAGLILLFRWLYWLIRHREGIGLGDAKLMALLAAWLDLPGALLAFGIGIVFAALVAVVLLVLPSARLDKSAWAAKKLPLGTFLCIGGIISSLWGQPILAAYLRWASF